MCIENLATFYTDNCGKPSAQALPCWILPECGGPSTSNTWWTLAAGLATSVLVLSLALSRKWR